MDDELPNNFDIIVVGTGFTESVVAAAASRIGKIVLHLDPNDYYGGNWASFNLENLQTFIDNCKIEKLEEDDGIKNNSIKLINNLGKLENIEQEWIVGADEDDSDVSNVETTNELPPSTDGDLMEEPQAPKSIKWTKEMILKESRKFNIDVTPKLLFARGSLVDLLISSNICRYTEFRAVDRVLTFHDDELRSVPCTRSDVFTTNDVNVVEKRLLMRILTNCLAYTDGCKEHEMKTFKEYLEFEKLTPKLIHYILYAICMGDDEISYLDGVKNAKKFLASLGHYGNTPFLFPMYGCGEIPQCFCRLCAVFGGIYCLKRPITNLNLIKLNNNDDSVDDNLTFDSIECGEQKISGKNILFGNGCITKNVLANGSGISNDVKKCGNISRGIFITSTPLGDTSLNTGGGGVNFLKIPAGNGSNSALVMQLSHYSGTCPKGLYMIHIITEKVDTAKSDLQIFVKRLFADSDTGGDKPKILWALYFNIPSCTKCTHQRNTPIRGVHIACGPYFELDYDNSIEKAKEIFTKMYPNEEFLPRAPDPEEIIIGDEAEENNQQSIEDIIEKMSDVVELIESEEKCIEENTLNESKIEP